MMTMTTRKKTTRPANTTTVPTRPADAMPEPPSTNTPLDEFADAVAGARSAYLAWADGRGWGELPLDQRQEIKQMTKWLADMHLR
jgi:hypothetical protein